MKNIEKPIVCNHENLRLYGALKAQVELNERLQIELLAAAKVIEVLTEKLNETANLR